jgi:hypothetical protein
VRLLPQGHKGHGKRSAKQNGLTEPAHQAPICDAFDSFFPWLWYTAELYSCCSALQSTTSWCAKGGEGWQERGAQIATVQSS